MQKRITKKIPKLQTRAEFSTNSIDLEKRTLEVTWTTGYKGVRRGFFGEYYEELSLEPGHVDMSHLKSGRAKFLDSHDMQRNDSVIGVIEGADIGTAKIRFSKDEIAERNLQKIRDGILTDVSVGYMVSEYTDVSKEGDEIPTYRATKWKPIEISLVPMGFDPGATVRSNEEENEMNEVVLITRSNNEQSAEILSRSEPTKESLNMTEAEMKAQAEKLAQDAKLAERTRCENIRKAVKEANLSETLAESYISRDLSFDEAKRQIDDVKLSIKEQEKVAQVAANTRVDVGTDEQDKKRTGFQDALLNRVDSQNFKVTEASKIFVGKGLLRMIEDYMGRHIGESDSGFAKRAMSSSDLPLILANIAEKSAQKRYDLAPRTFESWTKSDTLRNYKEHRQVQGGDFASLLERKESGEFQYGSFGEKQEVAQLKDFGIIHKFTSQMLVNDDLKMITKIASEGGTAARRLENKLAYSALTTNKNMGDGGALYNTTAITTAGGHANLGTAAAIAEASVAEAYRFMRKQKSADSLDPLNLRPKFFICGPDKEVEARKFFSSILPSQTSNVNVFQNSMEVIVDAEITGNQYYFLADPNQVDTVTCFRLEGQESPSIESRSNWSDDSLELKVAHTFAAEPMDWRGIVKNAGA